MPITFALNYNISSKVMNCLIRIEAAKQKILHLSLTPTVLNSLNRVQAPQSVPIGLKAAFSL